MNIKNPLELVHAERPYRIVNLGFQTPRLDDTQYVLGGGMVPKVVIYPDGQWLDDLPEAEPQFNKAFDTYGCTCFGTDNALEILEHAQWDTDHNYSDRFTYIVSETRPPGNDPHIVAESIRNAGQILENELPFLSDIDNLLAFSSLGSDSQALLDSGKKWKSSNEFLHEWVFNTRIPIEAKQERLMECLQYSPLGVSVLAWMQDADGLYFKDPGSPDSHWCVLVGYVKDKYWIIYDSYPNSDGSVIKYLRWDYDFGFAKRYYQDKRTPALCLEGQGFWSDFFNLIKGLYKKHE